ncbi:MAG: lyase family protein, partial [Thermoproteota archaeon]
DPESFEKEVLSELGLKPAMHSTQIVEPQFITDLACSVISCFSVLANLADDFRHLQRSEIQEIEEVGVEERVGSSTMPHKVNPWDFEHVKSM